MTNFIGFRSGVFPGDTSNLGREQVLAIMRTAQGELSDKDFAAELGISPAYLCDIYNGHRQPGSKVLMALGLERHITYSVQPEGLAAQALRRVRKDKRK